ncbi:MAG: metal ABC transporter solute-binding protein, Zn/Mn family [Acidimicrobiales bacterium]
MLEGYSDEMALREEERGRRRLTPRMAWMLPVVAAVVLSSCGSPGAVPTGPGGPGATIAVVAAENQYGNVAFQVGGRYVHVASVISNPNTDPHVYEVSTQAAREIASAQVVVQNGLGYDNFMSKLEAASPDPGRRVITVQHLLGLADSTPNPHLWYMPATMPKVADRLASDFSSIDPAHAGYFQANAARFVKSLDPWMEAISHFKRTDPSTPVATTEPVADYMLEAAGAHIVTPFTLQADLMNGVDPSPEDVAFEASLLRDRKVKVFVYNQQVTDPLTQSFMADARRAGIPVVGVYETMPGPGYDYQTWMLAEMRALGKAVARGVSTSRL